MSRTYVLLCCFSFSYRDVTLVASQRVSHDETNRGASHNRYDQRFQESGYKAAVYDKNEYVTRSNRLHNTRMHGFTARNYQPYLKESYRNQERRIQELPGYDPQKERVVLPEKTTIRYALRGHKGAVDQVPYVKGQDTFYKHPEDINIIPRRNMEPSRGRFGFMQRGRLPSRQIDENYRPMQTKTDEYYYRTTERTIGFTVGYALSTYPTLRTVLSQVPYAKGRAFTQDEYYKRHEDVNILSRRSMEPPRGENYFMQRRRGPLGQIDDNYRTTQRKTDEYFYRTTDRTIKRYVPTTYETVKRVIGQEPSTRRHDYSQDKFYKHPEDVNILSRKRMEPSRGQYETMHGRRRPLGQIDNYYRPIQRKVDEYFYRKTEAPTKLNEFYTRKDQKEFAVKRFSQREYHEPTEKQPFQAWPPRPPVPEKPQLQKYPRGPAQFSVPSDKQYPHLHHFDRFSKEGPPMRVGVSRFQQQVSTERIQSFVKPLYMKPQQFEIVTKMSIHTNFSAEIYRDLVDTIGPARRTGWQRISEDTRPSGVDISEETGNYTLELFFENTTYSVPCPKVEAQWKKGKQLGFTVSIPDNGFIAEYHFHGSNIKPGKYTLFMPGLWNKVITKPKDGWFTFKATNTDLKVGDTVYFWLLVLLKDGMPYIRDRLNFTILYVNGTKIADSSVGCFRELVKQTSSLDFLDKINMRIRTR